MIAPGGHWLAGIDAEQIAKATAVGRDARHLAAGSPGTSPTPNLETIIDESERIIVHGGALLDRDARSVLLADR
jgi:hypothetical protein